MIQANPLSASNFSLILSLIDIIYYRLLFQNSLIEQSRSMYLRHKWNKNSERKLISKNWSRFRDLCMVAIALKCHENVLFRDLKSFFCDSYVTKSQCFVTGNSWNPHFSWQKSHDIPIFRDRKVTNPFVYGQESHKILLFRVIIY